MGGKDFKYIVDFVIDLLAPLIPVLIAASMFVFFLGLARYIWGSGDPKSKDKARSLIGYGLLAFFVFFSIWALVGIVTGTFGDLLRNSKDVDVSPLFRGY